VFVTPMNRLTEKDDWSPDYVTDDIAQRLAAAETFHRTNKNVRELWDRVLLPILRECGARTAVEIGSAPGQNLVRLSKELGVAPFGIEYTEEGARLNRELFIRNGLNPDNVLCEDFFSPTLDSLAGTFDIVVSFGFVEHFDDPVPAIKRQIDFCRPGGYVAIIIPNIQGIYYVWNKVFNPRVIETHNTAMMRNGAFFAMCEEIANFEVIFGGSDGAFEYGLLTHNNSFISRAAVSIMRRLAPGLRLFDQRVLAPLGVGLPSNLVVVGKKKQ
jgi:SAM-dependent methyltransferase